jgi:Prophage minor tail protein Z (GPZ)
MVLPPVPNRYISGTLGNGVTDMKLDVRDNITEVMRNLKQRPRDAQEKAIPRALNRTAEMATTNTSRVMRAEGYNFSASEIKAAISISRASSSRLTVTIKTKRRTKSLMAFNPRQSKAGVTVKVHGQAKLIKGAFIAQRQNGVQGVYVEDKSAGKIVLRFAKQYKRGSRGGWHDYPARKLNGPSVGGVAATKRMQELTEQFVKATFSTRLAQELRYASR